MLKPEQSIKQLLDNRESNLANLIAKANSFVIIQNIVSNNLEDKLKIHCRVIDYKNGCLTIAIDNSHWLNQLKFSLPELLTKLRKNKEFFGLTTIKPKVMPKPSLSSKNSSKTITKAKLDKNSSENLKNFALSVSDENIKNALLNLASDKENL